MTEYYQNLDLDLSKYGLYLEALDVQLKSYPITEITMTFIGAEKMNFSGFIEDMKKVSVLRKAKESDNEQIQDYLNKIEMLMALTDENN